MAALSSSESRRMYSWWWDSHNTPKNSKWLHENIADMDSKVKTMIKLIEEDADSFRRKAEMYYEKRPELMKFVEEFYRAYRALAERYDHATGELRHAHRTLAKAFPDQVVPSELTEDSPSETSAEERERAMKYVDDLFENLQEISSLDIHDEKGSDPQNENSEWGLRKRDLKELSQNVVQFLKKALADVQAEKEDVLLQYQQCLQKLSKMEEGLSKAQWDSVKFNEKVSLAEIEIQTLKEALIQLETEKNAASLRHKYYLDKISDLEATVSKLQEEMKGLDNRAVEAVSQSENLRDEMSRLVLEKEQLFQQHNHCLLEISNLENIVSGKEDEAQVLKKQAERIEAEVSELQTALADLNEEKEASAKQYKCCLETILRLEKDLASANDDIKRLNIEILDGNAKLTTVEGNCTRLELSNRTLHVEADNLAKKIAMKDQELSKKKEELEKLQKCLQYEHEHHAQVEATLLTLQDLHSQSQVDQKGLALEIENMLQMLKVVESSKTTLMEEIQQVKNENQCLNQANSLSVASIENMQSEIISLKEIKEKLGKEVSHHKDICTSHQQQILHLKEEIKSLNRSYQALIEQVEAAGLNPECIMTSLKSLQDENSRLRETCEHDSNAREILLKKLEKMEEVLTKAVVVESSLLELNAELENSHEKAKTLQESHQILQGEKATLVGEKASLLSQLQSMTENMHNLLEKNAVLENSLSTAKVELEGLREKSKGLEEICELLRNERSYLLTERDSLVSKLQHVEGKLENMEKRYMGLEEKYASLQKEKESMHCQVDKLEVALGIEKQERTSSQDRSETRLVGLENQIHLLQEENRWKKKESEEELEKTLKAQFELSVLQKFIKDMEEKNYSLIIECQKHVEASKLAERVISELESESLEQQVEAELLLDEIERLRLGIYQIFRSLETAHDYTPPGKVENERAFTQHILERIEDMKCAISEQEDEKQQLVVENSVLIALLKQLESRGMDIVSQKVHLEHEVKVMGEKFAAVTNEKDELQDLNKQLKSDVSNTCQNAAVLEAELANLCAKQADLQTDYYALREAYSQVSQENTFLLNKFSKVEEEKRKADQHNDAVIWEFMTTANQSEVLRNFGTQKVSELKILLEDLNRQHEVNNGLEMEVLVLRQKLELQNAESVVLKDAVRSMESQIQEMRECNDQMNRHIENREEKLINTEAKLLDVEMKLEAAEELNSTLYRTVADLKNDIQHSQQMRESRENDLLLLSEENAVQKKEINGLQMVNKDLESELGQLHQEIEENMMRELTLTTELQEINNEFEVWEAEASTFCFDLQVSSIQEVLLKNKVQELTEVCKTLENDRTSKSLELEEMKGKIQSKDNEISNLKSQLSAYTPIIASLQDDITILENSVLSKTTLKAVNAPEPEFLINAASPDRDSFQVLPKDQPVVSLRELHTRVKAVRKLMEEANKPLGQTTLYYSNMEEPAVAEGYRLTPKRSFGRDKHERSRKKGLYDSPKLQKSKSKISEGRSGSLLMKDIPLDHVSEHGMLKRGNVGSDDLMLELWETAEYVKAVEPPFTHSGMEKEVGMDCKLEFPAIKNEHSQEVSNQKILERLASDAKKLEILQSTLDILREKWESNKKSIKKAQNLDDVKTVNEKLLEAEDTLIQLMDLNSQLVNHVELCPQDEHASPRLKETVNTWMMKVMEQADKGAERIGRLQLELQKIQYSLLKLVDDKKVKGRNRFFKSRSIILRDFVNSGRKNSRRRKKSPNCVCFRQSASGKVNSL